ncbi:MAG: cryptochrome/photolyase family protein, partial [Flavitalea sp.]
MSVKPSVNIFWFRRDLRLVDNAALYHALKSNKPIVPIFIFDRYILDQLEDKKDRRVAFIHAVNSQIQEELVNNATSLEVYYGFPNEVFLHLHHKYEIQKVFTNHDYEPYAIGRDESIRKFLEASNINFQTFKDHVIFEKNEIVKDDGSSYTVFTPYSKKWKNQLTGFYYKPYPSEDYVANFYKQKPVAIPSLNIMGFENRNEPFPAKMLKEESIKEYDNQRDYPALNGTSRIGIHLRFGTVSIRGLVKQAMQLNDTYLNELIWREFYQMILWHFPKVGKGSAFKAQYEFIEWRNDEEEFRRWCEGSTGYPIVDAGMRELNATGFMHNRVRMIVASFLTKHLLIDWRWGEAYFAQKLL